MVRKKSSNVQDSVKTPDSVLNAIRQEFGDYSDPCPYQPNFDPKIHKCGLTTAWSSEKVNFCNPPYSRAHVWIQKARREWELGKDVVLFIKLNSLGNNYSKVLLPGAEVRIYTKKFAFEGYGGRKAMFSNVLVIFRKGETSNKLSFI